MLFISDFEVHPDVRYFNWAGFPVFYGLLSGAFEGIGLVSSYFSEVWNVIIVIIVTDFLLTETLFQHYIYIYIYLYAYIGV